MCNVPLPPVKKNPNRARGNQNAPKLTAGSVVERRKTTATAKTAKPSVAKMRLAPATPAAAKMRLAPATPAEREADAQSRTTMTELPAMSMVTTSETSRVASAMPAASTHLNIATLTERAADAAFSITSATTKAVATTRAATMQSASATSAEREADAPTQTTMAESMAVAARTAQAAIASVTPVEQAAVSSHEISGFIRPQPVPKPRSIFARSVALIDEPPTPAPRPFISSSALEAPACLPAVTQPVELADSSTGKFEKKRILILIECIIL